METRKKKVSNARDIGQQITKNDYQFLKRNYQETYGEERHFIIPKDLILEALNLNENVAGIRFMYGLKDSLNPYSNVLFLIPCSNISENLSTEAMLVEHGYSDHQGNLYSVQEVLLYISQYIQSVSKEHPELNYKEITRGNFYGKNSLESLLTRDAEFIQYDFGYNESHVSPVVQSLDLNLNSINEVYMDFSRPCPNACGDGDDCISTLTVEIYSSTKNELSSYRTFRDNILLQYEGGAQLFEMYYFVSPVVAKILNSSPHKEVALEKFYQEEITPFRLLMEEGNFQESVDSLRNTLHNLFQEYEYSKVFA